MRDHRFLIVDVFTERAFAGNQLAVFTNAVGLTTEQMQALALEIGFSETCFVLPAEKGGDFRIRIFTPVRELTFAGHPTLGSAFAMAGPLQSTVLRIETAEGIVPVAMQREGAKLVAGTMQQPIPTVSAWCRADELLMALGLSASDLPIKVYDNGVRHVFVAVATAEQVASLTPDLNALGSVAGEAGVSVFAFDGERAKVRMFMRELASGEDAATGSAAGPLAVHLARHGKLAWGEELVISQGSEIGRPSTLYARAHAEGDDVVRVEVTGSAVVVGRGEFRF